MTTQQSSIGATRFGPLRGADDELIYQALRFYFWAAGQGISPVDGEDALEPEEAFMQFTDRTNDEAWETVADRFRRHSQEQLSC